MDFALTSEQVLIKQSAERYVADAPSTGAGAWTTFAELGWLGIGAPEELGGFGGAVETLLLMEAFGRGLVAAPYLSQAVLAGSLLRHAGSSDLLRRLVDGEERFAVAYDEAGARFDPAAIETSATQDASGYVVRGRKIRVLDAATAGTLLVSARGAGGVTLLAVPRGAPGVTIRDYVTEDGRSASEIRFDEVRVEASGLLGERDGGLDVLERALDHAIGALCAEALGVMSVMHEVTLEYLKARTQFGVAIGSFQALQHRMADMFVELELARSMAYVAAMTLETETDSRARKRGISGAKVQIARSGRFVGQNAIQLHGAIGMTDEYKIGHYFKRMTTLERLFGDADYHLARYVGNARSA
jgi:alkylation response protein AidB-like acyl-CoA dehydrogenase